MIARTAIRAVAVALALAALYRYVWLPWRADFVLFRTMNRTSVAESLGTYRATGVAHENIAELDTVAAACTTDLNFHMLYAANALILRDWDTTERHYAAALSLDQRPEIYYARSLVSLQRGNVDAAVRDLTIATRFDPMYAENVTGELRLRVRHNAGLE